MANWLTGKRIRFNGEFPGPPGLASVRILLHQEMMGAAAVTSGTLKTCKGDNTLQATSETSLSSQSPAPVLTAKQEEQIHK